jgi:hypothetical protein
MLSTPKRATNSVMSTIRARLAIDARARRNTRAPWGGMGEGVPAGPGRTPLSVPPRTDRSPGPPGPGGRGGPDDDEAPDRPVRGLVARAPRRAARCPSGRCQLMPSTWAVRPMTSSASCGLSLSFAP